MITGNNIKNDLRQNGFKTKGYSIRVDYPAIFVETNDKAERKEEVENYLREKYERFCYDEITQEILLGGDNVYIFFN